MKYRVGMWWAWPHGGNESNSIEVHAASGDQAVAEALSQVSGGRISRSCAQITPEITSCVEVAS